MTAKDASKRNGKHIANIRGTLVPYVRLREMLRMEGTLSPLEQIVVTQVEGHRVGFVVDHVIGEHQTVMKTMGTMFKKVEMVSGATILGNGTVALILDVPKLFHAAETQERALCS